MASGLSVSCHTLGMGMRLQGKGNCPPYSVVENRSLLQLFECQVGAASAGGDQ
jgi:hypothetical protein